MRVFISHSHLDEKVVLAFSEFLASIGFDRRDIFCSSISGQGVGAEEINSRILEELATTDIAFLIISDSYSRSEYCLNEMGAIWLLKRLKSVPFYSIKLPNIHYDEIKGFINSNVRQYSINIKDLKMLIQDLLPLLDIHMDNMQIDNTAESFCNTSLAMVVQSIKEPFECIINEDEWEFIGTEKNEMSEDVYLKENYLRTAKDAYLYTIKFDNHQRSSIRKIIVYKMDFLGPANTWYTTPDFSSYNIDSKGNIFFTERTRRKYKIQIF